MPDDDENLFEEKHTDEDILEFIRTKEVATTKEVSENFDYHMQTARRRLKTLEENGELNMKDVGKRFVWWLPRD